MPENYKLLPIRSSSGIKRDGTMVEGAYWTDGLWTRFYRGLPRSMKGYRQMSEGYHGPSRALLLDSRNQLLNLFSGHAAGIEVAQFTYSGFGASPVDITPAGFVSNANNDWQLAKFYSTNGGGYVSLLAHAAPNLSAIDSTVNTPVYYGDITLTTALATTGMSVSGGVMNLNPFAVAYGNNGLVAVSDAGDETTFGAASQFNICSTKIVKGMPIRGGQYAPSALMWSLEELLRMSFVGGTTVWQFDTLSDQSSILSSNGVVEYDGVYYWPGVDRWLMYNGVLRELPNSISLDFFFENLNMAQRQKVFGYKIPRWGEICWCAPMFGATECNWMFVYNVRENTWYDTPLPNGGRSAAVIAQTFPYPIMSSSQPLVSSVNSSTTTYPIWQHEFGVDEIRGNIVNAIPSYVTTPTLSLVGGGLTIGGVNVPSDNMWTQLVRFEPDFLMGPSIDVDILARDYPMNPDVVYHNVINSGTDNIDIDKQGRYVRYKIGTNTRGGYFVFGQSLMHFRAGDRTP